MFSCEIRKTERNPPTQFTWKKWQWSLKAKFHYASWFEAASKLVGDQLRTSFEPASNQLRAS